MSQRNPSLKFKLDEPSDFYDLIKRGHSFSGRERNCCFLNVQGRRFADVSAVSGIDFDDDGRAISFVDWDFDGDLDAWLVNRTGPQVRVVRNELPKNDQDFLEVKLQGVTCNRDAVGARVTVHLRGDGHAPLMRTRRAGEGFLTQSSQWLHFGLGQGAAIEKVVVRWPGGGLEEFTDLAPNGFYQIKQGAGKAARFTPPQGLAGLKAQPLPMEKLEAPPRSLLGGLVPVPALKYRTWDGKDANLDAQSGRPLLLVFWASWCEPCLDELKRLDAAKDELAAAGIDVLALSVDGVSSAAELATHSFDDPKSAAAETERRLNEAKDVAHALVQRLNLALPSGMASTRLVDGIQLMLDESLARVTPIGVPQSFLLDARLRVFGVYRGAVDVRSVLSDAKMLSLDDAELRARAVPFAGRWHTMPFKDVILHVATSYLNQDFVAEGIPYVETHGDRLAKCPSYAELLMTVGDRLLAENKFDDAAQWCRRATEVDGELQTAHHLLGLAEYQLGHSKAAARALRRALELRPTHVGAQRTLAWILATTPDASVRNGEEAVKFAERALDASAGPIPDPIMLDILGAAYAAAGNFRRAVEVADEGLRLARERENNELVLSFEERLKVYRSGKSLEEGIATTNVTVPPPEKKP
ncbi:MAG: ASPIC/UnbV domain-containing protein [Planctomycetia bacterium]|nr:ASPIC/UnbV domain-containing protein [Planctomycetia bacterium]